MRILAFLLAISVFATNLSGQTSDEAIRYSQTMFGGSARGMGVAGAFNAIGADFTSILSNPAGLGFYRSSEIMITPRFESFNTESTYLGNGTNDSKFNFNIGNVSGVVSKVFGEGVRSRNGWVSVNFGIGINRTANFNNNRFYRAINTNNSELQSYVAELEGTFAGDITYDNASFEAVMAYDAYLINPVDSNASSYTSVTDLGTVNQSIYLRTSGGIDEFSLSAAGNFKNKIYVGGYLGIPFLHYEERSTHRETDYMNSNQDFNFYELNDRLDTWGAGVNFKVGMIYRATDWLRLGAAFHTPTFYGLTDDFSSDMDSDFDTIGYSIQSPAGEFKYNLSTPMRISTGIGIFLKQRGFLSFDYEWVNYSKANFDFGEFKDFEQGVNDEINAVYGSAHIFRVGLELAIKAFRLRGGFAHYGSPFSDTSLVGDADQTRMFYTGGMGFRLRKWFMDLAYVRNNYKSIDMVVNDQPAVDEAINNSIVFTVGYTFR